MTFNHGNHSSTFMKQQEFNMFIQMPSVKALKKLYDLPDCLILNSFYLPNRCLLYKCIMLGKNIL